MAHTPVLLKETVSLLSPKPGMFAIDGTFGSGGHARAIAGMMRGEGTLLGLDWNRDAASRARDAFGGTLEGVRLIIVGDNFANLPAVRAALQLPRADILLLDLGFSSDELAQGIGLSFKEESGEEPLDMRYGGGAEHTAADIVNRKSADALADIFRELGDERYAAAIAKRIVEHRKQRPFKTVGDLTSVIASAVPRSYERGRINPATRVFQALRITVNRELENLEAVLRELPRIVAPGGRAAVISFHSLEDKIVKESFKTFAKSGSAEVLTKKPISPTEAERKGNPRSRSAKLRVIEFSAASH